jgi:uncharacterized repeat protein (TIGR03803 family)
MPGAERDLRRASSASLLLLGIACVPVANARAQTYAYEILHKFSAEIVIGRVDGSHPTAAVIRDAAGNLYGTTTFGGGKGNAGTVYEVDTAGHETVLHTFAAGADGYGRQLQRVAQLRGRPGRRAVPHGGSHGRLGGQPLRDHVLWRPGG